MVSGVVSLPRAFVESPDVARLDDSHKVLRGVELSLNLDTSTGYVVARDSVAHSALQNLFTKLVILGWRPIDDDESVEPYDFEDGARGVKIWLYRVTWTNSSILCTAKAA